MEQRLPIRYTRKALHDIDLMEQYIAAQGYPETAISYSSRVLTFVENIAFLPHKNTLCKYPPFARRGFYCAAFEKTFIIAYRVRSDVVEIIRIVHGKRLVY